jgi:hypothetical protein
MVTIFSKGHGMKVIAKSLMVLALVAPLSACGGFGGKDREAKILKPETTAIGVNGYLWQATLDTLSFMPFQSVDPSAGAIITDWVLQPDAPDERVKVSVLFQGELLRSDGLKVNVVRQAKQGEDWVSVPVKASTALEVEEAILTRARQIKIGNDTD